MARQLYPTGIPTFSLICEETLQQSDDRHYADAFMTKGKEVVKVGMNVALKDGVNMQERKTGYFF